MTTASPHGFIVGKRIYVNFSSGTNYNAVCAPILSVPSATTFTYYNNGYCTNTTNNPDELAPVSDGAIFMLLDSGPLSSAYYTVGSTSCALRQWDGFFAGQACLNFGAITSGAAATSTLTFAPARVGDRIVLSPTALFTPNLILSAAVTSLSTITFQAVNPTAGSITPAAFLVRFELMRK